MIDWLTDWLWLIDWLIDWLFGWLTDWLIDWLVEWSIDWLIDRMIYRTVRQEMSILLPLRHQNVVSLLGYCLNPFCMVLEFAPQGALDQVLANYKRAGVRLNAYVMQKCIVQVITFYICTCGAFETRIWVLRLLRSRDSRSSGPQPTSKYPFVGQKDWIWVQVRSLSVIRKWFFLFSREWNSFLNEYMIVSV